MKNINILSLVALFILSSLSLSAQTKFVTSVASSEATTLTINDEDATKNFFSSASSQKLKVTSNLELFVKSDVKWCKPTIKADTKEVTISVDANTSKSTRYADVTIYGKDNKSAIVKVVQLGTEPAILVNQTSVYVDNYAKTFTIGISSNIEFTVEKPTWITGPDKTPAIGFNDYVFTLTEIKDPYTQNKGNIVIKAKNGEVDPITIPVVQEHVGYPRFAVISDVHFGNSKGEGPLVKIPKALKNITSHGKLDALFIVGDLTESGTAAQYAQLVPVMQNKANYTNPIDTIFYMLGNHDNYSNGAHTIYQEGLKPLNGGKLYPLDQYVVIKGYPFIMISQRSSSNTDATNASNGTGSYPQAVQDTISSWMARAAKECPGKPIFFFTHVPLKFTCYSSWPNEGDGTSWPTWSMKTLNPILNKYPQTIAFGGHSHYPIGDPRSIHQGVNPNSSRENFFTGINTGSSTYSEVHRPSVEEGIHPKYYDYVTEALMLQILANGDVEIRRLDSYRNVEMLPEKPWIVKAPHDGSMFQYADKRDADDTNKGNYTLRTGLPAPEFKTGDAITIDEVTMSTVKLTFPQATDDECVFRYKVAVKDEKGVEKKSTFQFSYFYLTKEMPETLTVTLSGLKAKTKYTIEVTAYDSYDNISKAITKEITTEDDTDPANQPPAAKGLWLFDDTSNLLKATTGAALVPGTETTSGGVTVVASAADANIVTTAGPTASNKAVLVPKAALLKMVHGSSTGVGSYTLMYDVKITTASKYRCLLQTTLTNKSVDGDLFINESNYVGLSASGFGYGSTKLQVDTWYRIVFTVNNGVPSVYLDGSIEKAGTGANDRWKLPINEVLFFADNNGEDNDIEVAEIRYWDSVLTVNQIANLGSVE
ncbi:putative phosphodiesterase [Dysgonomonadaceae bacterium PH5-43]|nr:putative phosphodiesterase [Dysgonomonadaceae bacterium PH5-43]